MFDEWANQLAAAGNYNSGNIYQNAAFVGGPNATQSAAAAPKAAIQADIDETARRESIAEADARKKLEQKREEDKKDPSKAIMKLREDGMGYDFFDGTGQPIGINEYSLITGIKPDKLLEDSDNPKDMKFVQEYRLMNKLVGAFVNGDKETLATFRATDPERFQQLIQEYKTPQEMMAGFMNHYSDYYKGTAGKNQASDPAFAPLPKQAPTEEQFNPLLGASLEQTLAPVTTRPEAGNWWDRNNPFSGRKDAINRWEEQNKTNPWAHYYSSLMGG